MRLFIPELEIRLQKVACDNLLFDGESIRCMIADFILTKYPKQKFTVNSVRVSLERASDSYSFDCSYDGKVLNEPFLLSSKKSEVYSAIIQMRELPFDGIRIDDKLVFIVSYSFEENKEGKEERISYLFTETGWTLFENTCPKIQNHHFKDCILPVIEDDRCTVTLTGVAFDYEKTYYYFSLSNYSDEPVRLFSWQYLISVDKDNIVNTFENIDDLPIATADSHETVAGVFEMGTALTGETDLMNEIAENPAICKATASICVSLKTKDEEDEDEGILSRWIVGELGIIPQVPSLEDDFFVYKEPPKPKELTYKDFVVYSSKYACLYNHDVEPIDAVVKIITPAGECIEKRITASYCRECDIYLLLNYDYLQLCQIGTLQCKQISFDQYVIWRKQGNSEKRWSERSKLNILGYNANAKENLTDAQRRRILLETVERGVMTVEEIQRHLIFLIELPRKNSDIAREKWKRDYDFISHYTTDTIRSVGVGSIMRTVFHIQED